MAIDFMTCEGRIELNKERLAVYNEGLERATGRISLISILYSLLSIYLVQLIKFAITYQLEQFFFLIFLAILIGCIAVSIIWTIKLLLPTRVAHVHAPKYFYTFVKEQYTKKGIPDEKLGQKIAATYLSELEQAVENNYAIYKQKRRSFYFAFNYALIALVPYLICASIMLGTKEKEDPQKIEITNAEILLQKIDSLFSK